MLKVFFLVQLLAFSLTANEAKISIPYSSLLAKQEVMNVSDVKVEMATDQNGLPQMRLLIKAMNACGKQTLVEFSRQKDGNAGLQFFQVGNLGPHIQPACQQVIEYYWQPRNYDLQDGESTVMTLHVGPTSFNSTELIENAVVLKVKVTMHVGVFPNGIGAGYYATYSDIEVDTSKVTRGPF